MHWFTTTFSTSPAMFVRGRSRRAKASCRYRCLCSRSSTKAFPIQRWQQHCKISCAWRNRLRCRIKTSTLQARIRRRTLSIRRRRHDLTAWRLSSSNSFAAPMRWQQKSLIVCLTYVWECPDHEHNREKKKKKKHSYRESLQLSQPQSGQKTGSCKMDCAAGFEQTRTRICIYLLWCYKKKRSPSC